MEPDNFIEIKKNEIRDDILAIRKISSLYKDLIFIITNEECGVKSGSDSWKDYIHYFLYSPCEKVVNICKQAHSKHNPEYGILNKIIEINEYGFTFCNRLEYTSQTAESMLDQIAEEIFILMLTDYKLIGNEATDFYKLKIDLGEEFYPSSSLTPQNRFKEILKKANYNGDHNNIAYTSKGLYNNLIKAGIKKDIDKTKVHEIEESEQAMWLKYHLELDFLS
ncbi:hypothetical protein [uncultured Draconibacterium sp.]|uniref:hypothetical protein n=1 Tax=uncultured Draconibacterium sp. TaxID=1573823 RepID=UPI0029C6BE95|nr:hypothetical protein [uncultured Draconibacterium sp.]